eukprot:4447466-Lingulodinium_polyedra.AAC.1
MDAPGHQSQEMATAAWHRVAPGWPRSRAKHGVSRLPAHCRRRTGGGAAPTAKPSTARSRTLLRQMPRGHGSA